MGTAYVVELCFLDGSVVVISTVAGNEVADRRNV